MIVFFFLVWRKGVACPEPYHCNGNNIADATLRLFVSLPSSANEIVKMKVWQQ